ncbi:BLUF domain-containing protein [Pedobacter sp. SD-b]|uniref:BLUF domain-containing protein n=1 Tax=Pedobacter segetis TaxID=2793069 RepID=A0ABS1BI29_9SPHI|nr:BLUF domain-containing protein [Pedobacter segetis]MBK0382537.1 BLUF domain-containing protein [Pedobacter segetis]
MIHYILYQGIESAIFKKQERGIEVLLAKAREKNKKLGITGMLLFIEGTFIQYIEGNEKDVKDLYQSIVKDKRLATIKIISEGKSEKRIFDNWDMAYDNFGLTTINKIEKIHYPDVQSYLKSSSAINLIKLMVQRKIIFEDLDS